MVHVGLVGCGTIGARLALAIERRFRHRARVVALHDSHRPNALRLQRRLRARPPICSLSALIRRSHLVIEAASAEAASRVVPAALRERRSVLVMSVGALLQDASWQRLAWQSGARVYIPSGALAGVDGIKAMAIGTIRRVSLTTRKALQALAAAPFVRRRRLQLSGRRRRTVLFEGSARSVVEAFPQNTNVAATLALASGRAGRGARVRVVADPGSRMNVHELDVVGDCGRIRCRIESRPSRSNPKTSELAVRSAIATLDEILGPIRIGT